MEILVKDVAENSYGQNYVCFSPTVSEALFSLKKFNYAYIYNSKNLKVNHERINKGFKILFDQFYEDVNKHNKGSIIYKDFLSDKSANYTDETPSALIVRDYISGMTDRYFADVLKKMVVPDISLGNLGL
jgi:dGTPase